MASCARIAHRAGINKERVYSYYGSKSKLFARVLREQLSKGTGEVLLDATDPESLAEFAGRMFDDNQAHPQYVRLLMWEALSLTGEVPEESQRREVYASRTAVIAAGQTRGAISDSIPPGSLHLELLALAGYAAVMPQVARCTRQIAAIWASAVWIGDPARSRAARTSAYCSTAGSSNGMMARVPRYGSSTSSIIAVNAARSRPAGSLRTPASNSASVMVVMATSSVSPSSHAVTLASGWGRRVSEMTFVSRTIM